MSIHPAIASANPTDISNLAIPISAAVALAVAAILGVFNPRSILGPKRLSAGESPRVFAGIIAIALVAMVFSELALGALHHYLVDIRHQPPATPISNVETVIYGMAAYAVTISAMLAATLTRPDGVRRTGINPARFPFGFLGGIFAIAIVLPLIDCIGTFTELMLKWLHKSPPPHELLQILSGHPAPWLRATVVLSACVVAPLAEEMFFRGLVQSLLRNLLNRPWFAVFLTAAMFAMVHPWWTWPEIFFLGISLGYVYERTGNLWMSITMHSLFNLTSIWLFVHFG